MNLLSAYKALTMLSLVLRPVCIARMLHRFNVVPECEQFV